MERNNRLTSASFSSVVSGSNYSQTFSYDALGNISSGPAGSYSYQGNQGSSYADPDAATSITLGTSTTVLTYDNDGNLLTTGNATDTWNYRDQMTQTITGSGSSTYAYDYTGARVKLRENATTTIFASNTYNVTIGASTTVKSIFANGTLIATVEGASSTIYYDLTDHLGGLNLVEATSGAGVETLDYYPYGQARVDIKGSSYGGEKRKYIGQEYDAATALSYLQARYYNGAQGQFISEDPTFLVMGSPHQLQQLGVQDQTALLLNPQSLNAYGYSNDNPITHEDAKGRYVELSLSGTFGFWSGSAGLRFDQNGVDWFAGAGAGYGVEAGIGLGWVPNVSLAHQGGASVNAYVQGADLIGAQLSKKIIGTNETDDAENVDMGSPPLEIVVGGGFAASVQGEVSGPMPYLTWGKPAATDYSQRQATTPTSIGSLPKTYLSQGPVNSGGASQISGASLMALQQELGTLSNILTQFESTIATYQSKK